MLDRRGDCRELSGLRRRYQPQGCCAILDRL